MLHKTLTKPGHSAVCDTWSLQIVPQIFSIPFMGVEASLFIALLLDPEDSTPLQCCMKHQAKQDHSCLTGASMGAHLVVCNSNTPQHVSGPSSCYAENHGQNPATHITQFVWLLTNLVFSLDWHRTYLSQLHQAQAKCIRCTSCGHTAK